MTLKGYLHSSYPKSLSEFGQPRELCHCRGWILTREIPGFPYRDAMGCYPFFSCLNWQEIVHDLEDIADNKSLVCLSLVTEPFADLNEEYLQECFRDVIFPFKKHYVVDLSLSRESYVSKHHRRNALKASRSLKVDHCHNPKEHQHQWFEFYQKLIGRHQIKGITVFSQKSFEEQMEVPGFVMLRARYGDDPVGMLLFYVQGNVAYYHLGAYSDEGYHLKASFALFWFAIELFAHRGIKWLSLGAGAGVGGDQDDGLTRFKKGWATDTRKVYFCGRIFDQERYAEITKASGVVETGYFPAYRLGEFE